MNDSYVSVVSAELITCGTLLGPLPLNSGAPDSLAVLTWRCIDKLPTAKQILKVTLKDQSNGRHNKTPSWLPHILPARNPDEQNLEVVVKAGQLYFRARRDIRVGEELRAWFGQDLADILKLPMIPPTSVDGEKRYECMLCQEQFENPYPVVAHLMYRCRLKDQGITTMQNPLRKRNGGRVKNFDIATLTDMHENENSNTDDRNTSPPLNFTNSQINKNPVVESVSERHLESPVKRKRRSEDFDESSTSPKKGKSSENKLNEDIKSMKNISSNKPHLSAFKLSSSHSSEFRSPNSSVDININETNNSSAFKKVDKSSAAFHSNISPVPNMFPGTLDPRDILFQGAPNGFPSFPYPLSAASGSPPNLPQNGAGVSPAILSSSPVDVHMTSAFVPSGKLTTTVSNSAGSIHQQLKMAEEFRIMRKMPSLSDSSYELSGLLPPGAINGARMPGMPGALNYAPKTQALDSFSTSKSFPTPLLPFLPPSLAALSFPTQNWCAKCNASFRMTSDLVYHMRSHHKRETDPQKLKREEKLRCHICNETFRERHHLTRHMTSH